MQASLPSRLARAFGAAAALVASLSLFAQLSDVPVRPGLWETHVITKIGANAIDAGPEQVCFSAGTTLGDYLTATNKTVPGVKCTVSNRSVAANNISYDTRCTGETGTSTGHIDFHVPDANHISGSSHTAVTRTSHDKSTTMEIDKTFSGTFVRSACGEVAPLVVPNHS